MIDAGETGGVSLFRQRTDRSEADLYGEILEGLAWRPHFYLIMAIEDGDEALERGRLTLRSLSRQVYRHWRLVIMLHQRAGDCDALADRLAGGIDTVAALRNARRDGPARRARLRARLLESFAELDERVSVVARRAPRPLPQLEPLQATAAQPAYLGLVQAGDELASDALAELATESGSDRGADFLYSDEERVNCATERVEPFLKPDWSPDLLLSTNYIGRLWCASVDLAARAGITDKDLLRLGEYDLVLRLTEHARAIRHVPRVLCRRGGDRLDSAASEQQALGRALRRRRIDGEITAGCAAGIYRVKRRLSQYQRVSIIIPTCGANGLFKTCIETLRRVTAYPNMELIAVDDIPPAEAAAKAWLRANTDKIVEAGGPFNWSRFNNAAARQASGDFLLFLNDDIEAIEPLWLEALVEHAARPEVGVVGPQLLYPDGTVQHAGMFLIAPDNARHAFRHGERDALGYFGLALTQRNVTAVTGACLMTRREVFWRAGGFDEAHDITNNDLDYCLKVGRLGLACVFTPYSVLIHHERASRGALPDHFDRGRFDQAWGGSFRGSDPYHHPRLSRQSDNFVVATEDVETLCAGHPLFDPDEMRNILVVKLDHIGDSVGAVAAVRRLKRAFPLARICVLCGSWARAIWSLVAEIDEIIAFDFFHADSDLPPRRLGHGELEALGHRLLPYGFDLAVDLRRHPEARLILNYTGARYTAGFDYQAKFPWLDIALDWQGDVAGVAKRQHFGDSLVNLVDAVAAAGERDRAVLLPRRERRPRLSDALLRPLFERRVVCVHPAVGNEMRRWPAAYFAQLIDLLVAEEDVNIALIGNDDDRAVVADVCDRLRRPDRVTSLVGEMELAELPHFLVGCALFVGNNSGPKHIAAGLGVPTVGIHSGNVDVREWGPVGPRAVAVRRRMTCSPCYLTRTRDCPRNLACLSELRPSDVYPACKRLLAIGYGGPDRIAAGAGEAASRA